MIRPLRCYAIVVNTGAERDAALKFYRLASHRPKSPWASSVGRYVGMWDRIVTCGSGLCSGEVAVSISQAKIFLTDTPARKMAWVEAFGPLEAKQNLVPVSTGTRPPDSDLPLVSFSYPKKNNGGRMSVRQVRVTKANDEYIEGYDLFDNHQFKRFLRIRGSMIQFISFKT